MGRISKTNEVVFCEAAKKFRQRDILERSVVDRESGCWLWQAAISRNGYARIDIDNVAWYAHRLAYEVFKEPIPKHLEIDHLCRVRHCVNPEHLEAVTAKENSRRGDTGLHNKAKTHCPRGHEYSGENLHINSKGERLCRACNRIRVRKYKGKRLY